MPDAAAFVFVVFVHCQSTEALVRVHGLPVAKAGFEKWVHQFNLASWLDTEPARVEVELRPGNDSGACRCEVDVRAGPGPPGKARPLASAAESGLRYSERKVVVQLDAALPAGSVRPIWRSSGRYDLAGLLRPRAEDLVVEVHRALQARDARAVAALGRAALANQAEMEGVAPALMAEGFAQRLLRRLPAGLRRARDDEGMPTYTDVLERLDLARVGFVPAAPEGASGTPALWRLDEPLRWRTKSNREFHLEIYVSAAGSQWYVARLILVETE